MRLRTVLLSTCLCVLAGQAVAQKALNVGVGGAFTSMDPHYHNLNPNNVLTSYVFDSLVISDPQFKPAPGLATSWKAVDETTWEFKLRDAKFSDGTPFTADDVVFTFDRVPKVLNSPSSFNFAVKPVNRIEVVDPHTIRLHSAAPVALMPYLMASLKIVSRKYGEGATTPDYNSGKAAIGTGPYKLTSFTLGDRAVFEKNETSWWADKIKWQKVNYRIIANDAGRIAALESGDVDVIDQVPPRDVATLKGNAKLDVISQPGQRLIYVVPDVGRKEAPFITDNAGKPLDKNPLQDVRVRKALSLAINRDALRDRIMDGFSAPTGQVVPDNSVGWVPSIKPDPYDPAQAKKLLAEAGYPDGFGITLHGPNDRYVNDSKLVEAIAQMWTRIGVKTKVETMPAATFFSRAIRNEFAIRLTGWASDTGEASSNLNWILASSNPDKGRGAVLDPTHFADPKVDALVEKALATVDEAQREALYREATLAAMPQEPIIPLHFQVNIWAIRKGFVFHTRTYEGTRAWDIDAP
ncbi:MAG: ABC transporter substrate-binding protein [Rhodospirillales bacterium]|nr:ABC transporter substrate-binding protein [Rhodospirillales bacterium]